jgi:hypothetical protein
MSEDGQARPNLTSREWSSLRVELELLGNQNISDWPGNVPLAQVAARCRVSTMAISKRRKKPAYRSGLQYLLAQELTSRLSRKDEETAQRSREMFPQPLSDHDREYSLWQMEPQWPQGGLRSPFNENCTRLGRITIAT